MIATTLTITTPTLKIAKIESKIFPVAKSRMTNEKHMAAIMPVVADFKKALSDSIQHQLWRAVCTPD